MSLCYLSPLSFVTSVVVHRRTVLRFSAPENVRSKPVYSPYIILVTRNVLSLLCAWHRVPVVDNTLKLPGLWAGRQVTGSYETWTQCMWTKGHIVKGRKASEPPQRERLGRKSGFLLEVTSDLRPVTERQRRRKGCVSRAQRKC